jgi:hypothetical protein
VKSSAEPRRARSNRDELGRIAKRSAESRRVRPRMRCCPSQRHPHFHYFSTGSHLQLHYHLKPRCLLCFEHVMIQLTPPEKLADHLFVHQTVPLPQLILAGVVVLYGEGSAAFPHTAAWAKRGRACPSSELGGTAPKWGRAFLSSGLVPYVVRRRSSRLSSSRFSFLSPILLSRGEVG